MNRRNEIEFVIGGKKYSMCGYESEEYLQKVAMYINAKISEIAKQDAYRMMDRDKQNMFLLVNMADDYFKMKKGQEETGTESDNKSREISNLKREIIDLKAKLENMEADNEILRTENVELQKKIVRIETELEESRRRLV